MTWAEMRRIVVTPVTNESLIEMLLQRKDDVYCGANFREKDRNNKPKYEAKYRQYEFTISGT